MVKRRQLPVVTVPRLLPHGGTAVCVASGPSLTEDDVAFCRGKALVIAVNDGCRLAPWADVLYASDADWWKLHKGVPSFAGLKYSCSESAASVPNVQILRQTGHDGLERDPTGIRTGRNSGAAAINVAVHLGASRVLLLGYDCATDRKGREHFFGPHPTGLRNGSPYRLFRQMFDSMVQPLKAAGVDVLNCSRRTELTAFPRADLLVALSSAMYPNESRRNIRSGPVEGGYAPLLVQQHYSLDMMLKAKA